jgi:hypothetical protein
MYPNMGQMWNAVHPAFNPAHVNADPVLGSIYQDAAAQLPIVDFVQVAGTQPDVTPHLAAGHQFRLRWDTAANLGLDGDYFAGMIIHELAHVAAANMYQHNAALPGVDVFTNLHLPAPVGVVNPGTGTTPNQDVSLQNQETTTTANWNDLDAELTADHNAGLLPTPDFNHLQARIGYAVFVHPRAHNDPVLADILYYMQAKGLTGLETYAYARRMLDEANQRRQAGAGVAGRIVPRPWYVTMWPRLPRPLIGIM